MPNDLACLAAPRMTMKDIAALSGVSVATVSRALAGSPRVTEATRSTIEAVVRRTGYIVNQAGRGLRLRTSRQLLVILPTISNPFFAEIVQSIEREAQKVGYGTLIGSTEGERGREEALARQLLSGAVDGLVLITGHLPDCLSGLEHLSRQVIAISEEIPDAAVRTIGIDNVQAAHVASTHLMSLGHRHIAHISGPHGNILSRQRLAGYRSALSARDYPLPPQLIVEGDFSLSSGGRAMTRLLQARPRPTAVFCANDDMAIGAIKAAREAGVLAGRDFAIVGFDDIDYAAFVDPPLTTIRQPRRLLGQHAAAALTNEASVPGPGKLPFELVIRASCCGPGARARG